MVPKSITREDLNNLESKIKQELTKQEIDNRHNLASQVQKGFNTIDDHTKELNVLSKGLALSNQFQETMSDTVSEIKDIVTSINTKINDLPKSFTTKEDHKANSDRIGKLEEIISWTAKLVIGAVILTLLGVIFVKTGGIK